MSVVPFKPRVDLKAAKECDPLDEDAIQHGAGEAFCFACDHTWTAVVPTGVKEFECPNCRRVTGRWKFWFAPCEGQKVRVCDCGNQLFYLTPEGHMCASCGVYQRY